MRDSSCAVTAPHPRALLSPPRLAGVCAAVLSPIGALQHAGHLGLGLQLHLLCGQARLDGLRLHQLLQRRGILRRHQLQRLRRRCYGQGGHALARLVRRGRLHSPSSVSQQRQSTRVDRAVWPRLKAGSHMT
jgi:hypothetical protein